MDHGCSPLRAHRGARQRELKAFVRCGILLLLAARGVLSHPEFGAGSVVNSASFMPVGLEAGRIAQGSVFSIFGTDMGPPSGAGNPEFPLRHEIGGVRISVRSGVDSFDAIPLFAGPFQVNAIMPSSVPLGPAQLIVNYTGGLNRPNSVPVDVEIVASSFGIYTISGSGQGPAAVQNFEAQGVTPINSLFESGRTGQYVILWGTGLGGIQGRDDEPPAAGSLPVAVEVMVGGKASPSVLYAGRSPCCSGVDQVVFRIPDDAPLGCYVPIFVRVAGRVISNSVTLSLSESGGTCSDPLNPIVEAAGFGTQALSLAFLALQTSALTDPSTSQTAVSDEITGVFGVVRRPEWYFDAALSLPALRSCVSYQFTNRGGGLVASAPIPPRDAGGTLNVAGGMGSAPVPRLSAGFYRAVRGPASGSSRVLSPGPATVSSNGGSNVGGFEVAIPSSEPLSWNSSAITSIDRSQGVRVEWSAPPSGTDHVRVLGVSQSSLDVQNNENGVFLCTAPADARSFFVPPEVLANIPVSATAGGISAGALYLGAAPAQATPTFQTSGADVGVSDSVNYVGRVVNYR